MQQALRTAPRSQRVRHDLRRPLQVQCSGQRRKKKTITDDVPSSVDGWLDLIRDETVPPMAPLVAEPAPTPSTSGRDPESSSTRTQRQTKSSSSATKPRRKPSVRVLPRPGDDPADFAPAPEPAEEETDDDGPFEGESQELREEADGDGDGDGRPEPSDDPDVWRDSTSSYRLPDGAWVFDLPSDDRRHHSVLTDDMLGSDPPGHKSGYVAVIGYPNAGKSTLINRIVGQKLSAVTHKAQTTRHRVVGISSGPDHQMILFDTPGILGENRTRLDQRMMAAVVSSIKDAEAIVAVVDASFKAKEALKLIQPGATWDGPPMAVLLNKVDLITPRELDELVAWYREYCRAEVVFTSCALSGQGVEGVKAWAVEKMPEGPTLYPKDLVSEQPERFFVSEIIREKIFLYYDKEVPYSSQVQVVEFKERPTAKDFISCEIMVERDSQVPILLGRGGSTLKALGADARKDIEEFLGRPVYLELSVKVAKDWRDKDDSLRSFGYYDKAFV